MSILESVQPDSILLAPAPSMPISFDFEPMIQDDNSLLPEAPAAGSTRSPTPATPPPATVVDPVPVSTLSPSPRPRTPEPLPETVSDLPSPGRVVPIPAVPAVNFSPPFPVDLIPVDPDLFATPATEAAEALAPAPKPAESKPVMQPPASDDLVLAPAIEVSPPASSEAAPLPAAEEPPAKAPVFVGSQFLFSTATPTSFDFSFTTPLAPSKTPAPPRPFVPAVSGPFIFGGAAGAKPADKSATAEASAVPSVPFVFGGSTSTKPADKSAPAEASASSLLTTPFVFGGAAVSEPADKSAPAEASSGDEIPADVKQRVYSRADLQTIGERLMTRISNRVMELKWCSEEEVDAWEILHSTPALDEVIETCPETLSHTGVVEHIEALLQGVVFDLDRSLEEQRDLLLWLVDAAKETGIRIWLPAIKPWEEELDGIVLEGVPTVDDDSSEVSEEE